MLGDRAQLSEEAGLFHLTAIFGEEVEYEKFRLCRMGVEAVLIAVGLCPLIGVDHHFPIDKAPQDDPLSGLFLSRAVLDLEQDVGIEAQLRIEESVALVFDEDAAIRSNNLIGAVADLKGLELAGGQVLAEEAQPIFDDVGVVLIEVVTPIGKSASRDDGENKAHA